MIHTANTTKEQQTNYYYLKQQQKKTTYPVGALNDKTAHNMGSNVSILYLYQDQDGQ